MNNILKILLLLTLISHLNISCKQGAMDEAISDYDMASRTPELNAAESNGNQSLILSFNVSLDPTSLSDSQISIVDESQNSLLATVASIDANKVYLNTEIQDSTMYEIQISQIRSLNQISNEVTTAFFVGDALPTVISVKGENSDGLYGIDSSIDIKVSFSEGMEVSGVPYLELNLSSGTTRANYLSGSGSSELIFRYTVANGDESNLLAYIDSSSLQLNGGSINDLNGNSALLTLPVPGDPDSLSDSSNFMIDGVVPTASISYSPSTSTVGNVTASLGSASESISITNNGGASDYIFSGNGDFTFTFEDLAGNQNSATATVTWIQSIGITVSPTSGLITTEGGGEASFSLVLDSTPTADVSIDLSSDNTTEGTVTPASLTFTSANWDIPQTVTVRGVDDTLTDGSQNYNIITAAAVSTDINYNLLDASDVSVTNVDDDEASAAKILASNTSAITGEDGSSVSIGISLKTQPTAAVILAVSSSNTAEGTVSPATLTFNSANWDVMQSIEISGVDDVSDDGDISYTINLDPSSSADSEYQALAVKQISMLNLDNDGAGFVVSNISGNTTELGGKATFTIRLSSAPLADVSISLSSSDTAEGTVSPASLTFTSGNWSLDQLVTVTGVDDGAFVDGDQVYSIITGAATSTDGNYNTLNPPDVTVTNVDDDSPGITVSNVSSDTTEDGGQATFSVVLNTLPAADVTIALTSTNTSEGTVSPTDLTFTNSNGTIPQTVTITGVNDLTADGDVNYSIQIGAAGSTDANYNGLDPADVYLKNIDNDDSSTFDPSTYGGYYKEITINTDSATIPASYTVSYTFDHASLVSGSKSNADGSDVRIAYSSDGGITWQEISRVLDDTDDDGDGYLDYDWNQSNTRIWFKSQTAVGTYSSDSNYRIYYRPDATSGALENRSSVYDIYDNFTDLSQWTMWQDDADSTTQTQAVQINTSCTGADDNNCVEIDSGGSLLGGIQHKNYAMSNSTDFIAFAKAKQSDNSVDLAPFVWYSNDVDGKSYAYLTNGSSNSYVGLDDSAAADGATFFSDMDNLLGPFAQTDTWSEYQLHHYTDGSIKVWRDGSQQFPVLGSTTRGLKNMQSGLVNMATSPQVVTISSVDTSKAFVYCTMRTGTSDPDVFATCELTDATTVTITSQTANANVDVSYFVVEFASDILVQRGSYDFTTDTTVNIDLTTAIDRNKSFILTTSNIYTGDDRTEDDSREVRAEFLDDDTITLTRSSNAFNSTVVWQVIQWNRASVQSGIAILPDGQTQLQLSGLNYINPETSFLIFNKNPSAGVNGIENRYYIRGQILDNYTIQFDRKGSTDDIPISYFVIDLGDDSNVQSGILDTSANDGTNEQTTDDTDLYMETPISTVNTSLAFPIISTSIYEAGNLTSTQDQDSGNWVATYPDSASLRVTRSSAEDRPSVVNYQVVEFASWSAADTTVTSGNFALGGKSPAAEIHSFDWIKLRKFVNPEPWVTAGSETAN